MHKQSDPNVRAAGDRLGLSPEEVRRQARQLVEDVADLVVAKHRASSSAPGPETTTPDAS